MRPPSHQSLAPLRKVKEAKISLMVDDVILAGYAVSHIQLLNSSSTDRLPVAVLGF
jgi:hypothetical protein